MPRHKRVDSDLDIQAPWIDTSNLNSTDQPIFSPISATVSSTVLTRTGKANEQQRTAIARENSIPSSSASLPPSSGCEDGPSTSEALMRFRGARVKVRMTATNINWKPLNVTGCCVDRRPLIRRVAFEDVLSAMPLPKPSACCCPREHAFVVYTFSRKGRSQPNTWRPEEYVLAAASPEAVKEWVGLINARVLLLRDRPRTLLVFINPYAGARLARLTWERQVAPIFQRARIGVTTVETSKQDHAREVVELMKAEELAGYQGVVAVGGDGLFQEVVSGLLARRARGDSAAHRIRVGHVPAGSTDAVAYTLHGSRCASTAALHIALGDRLSLDAGRVGAADGSSRHFVCQAGYGFMGDVMRLSERLRFLGPGRYDVTGALQYLRLASYRVALSYREAPSTTADIQQLCTAQCEVCRIAGIQMDHAPSYHRPSSGFILPGAASAPPPLAPISSSSSLSSTSSLPVPTASTALIRCPLPASTSTPTPVTPPATTSPAALNPGGSADPSSAPSNTPYAPPLAPMYFSSSVQLTGGGGGSGSRAHSPSGEGPGCAATAAAATSGNSAQQLYRTSSPHLAAHIVVHVQGHGQGSPGQQQGMGLGGSSPRGLGCDGAVLHSAEGGAERPFRGSSGGGAGGGGGMAGGAGSGSLDTPGRGGGKVVGKVAAGGGNSKQGAGSGKGMGGGKCGALGERTGSDGGAGGGAGGGGAGGPVKDAQGWTHLEGEFVSIMCVVTPCRSDKSKRGIVPNGHLSDGRMYLVLVSRCSHLAFLRFLLCLSTRGLADRCLPFVRVIPITGLRLRPLPGGHKLGGCLWDAQAPESAWNVDGELLSHNEVDISVQRGALEVFARGPETMGVGARQR